MKQPQRIKYKEKEYVIKYRHIQEDGIFEGEHSDRYTRGYTMAYIQPEGEKEIAACAFCSENDQYNKKIGRIISTARLTAFIKALEDGNTPVENEYYVNYIE